MAHKEISLKFGWLLFRCGVLPAVAASASAASIIFAGADWAAIDFGKQCEARSRPLAARAGTKPYAGFAFERGGRQGQFYAHLSRPSRPDATIVATIGEQPFLLAGRGEWGWSRNVAQQSAMIAAIRNAGSMRIDSRDSRGGRVVDRYGLSAAATAIDAAAAACAGKKG